MGIIDVDQPERFADESDRATSIEMALTEEAIKKQLKSLEKAPDDFDGCHCTVCGSEIPPERLATGAFRDLYCQQMFEKRKKEYCHD